MKKRLERHSSMLGGEGLGPAKAGLSALPVAALIVERPGDTLCPPEKDLVLLD
jgi:hypothetical protein